MNALSKSPIKEGNSIVLECVQALTNKSVNVLRWEHDNQPIGPCNGAQVSPKGTYHKLYIRKAQIKDTGMYQCIAEVDGKVQRANQAISILPSGQPENRIRPT